MTDSLNTSESLVDVISKALYKLKSNQWGLPGVSGRQLYHSLGPEPVARLLELAREARTALSRELSVAAYLRGMDEESAYRLGRWRSRRQFWAYVRRTERYTLPQPIQGRERHSGPRQAGGEEDCQGPGWDEDGPLGGRDRAW